jgi:hypothetical protein
MKYQWQCHVEVVLQRKKGTQREGNRSDLESSIKEPRVKTVFFDLFLSLDVQFAKMFLERVLLLKNTAFSLDD